ncbi:MAG: peptidoglycan binding domain-containing protein [Chloroflexota bacterium]|nr:peptidoglycan binding domain-containing protein [Chloroflexota bacterium]
MSATGQLDGASQRNRLPAAGSNHRRLQATARWLNRLLLALVLLLAAGIAGLGLYASSHTGQVFEGVSVAGVPVGGLTEADARQRVDERFRDYAGAQLTLVHDDETFSLAPNAIGARLDSDRTVAEAFAVGRTGSLWDQSRQWARGLVAGIAIAPRVSVDAARLAARLDTIAPAIARAPANARINMNAAEQPMLIADIPGIEFDDAANQAAIVAHIERLSPGPITLVSHVQPAAVPASSLTSSLEEARSAVAAPVTINAAEGVWHLPTSDLKRLVAVDAASGDVLIDRQSLQSVVDGLAASINRDPVNAAITVNDNGELAVAPSVDAATVDIAGSVAALEAAVLAGGSEVELLIDRATPAITDDLAAAAVERGEALINAGMRLSWSGGELSLGRNDLLRALTIRPQPGDAEPFAFGLDPAIVAELLAPAAAGFDREAADARFRLIDGDIRLVSEAREGRALDPGAAVEDVLAAFGDDEPAVTIAVTTLRPEVTAAARAGIVLNDDILAEASTYYGQSSEPRRLNVERGVELETGWLVPPGGVFSFAEALGGPIDEENGFVTGFGIVADEGGGVTTAPVIGGGICQVSTTLFQAAFWAGLEIEERWQHPYYLRSYGEAPMGLPGLDAMISVEPDWVLDLKFRNTTEDWIAVILTANGETVDVRIVGTTTGWEVEVEQPAITNLVRAESEMTFTDSPELAAGQTLLVESAEDGFDVAIARRVLDDGDEILNDRTASSFSPSRNLTLRGTGE